MIDHIRAYVVNCDTSAILQRENLSFMQEVNTRTGELKEKLKAEYYGLAFEYFPSSSLLTLSGSLHKYWNEGYHNYNDFSLFDLNQLEHKLYDDTGLRYSNLRLTRLEFGVNVQIKHNVKDVLDGSLMHKNERPAKRDTFNGKGEFLLFHHNRYDLKLYDKGKQYRQGEGLFRFEVKHTNWTGFRKQGFQTLEDVINGALLSLKADLLNKWAEVIFFDYTNEKPSKPEYKSLFYWEELLKKSHPTRKKHRDRLKTINKHEGSDLQEVIAKALRDKLKELLESRLSSSLSMTA